MPDLTRRIAPMLRELRECVGLPEDHPRRVAALAEKRRLLEEISWTSPSSTTAT